MKGEGIRGRNLPTAEPRPTVATPACLRAIPSSFGSALSAGYRPFEKLNNRWAPSCGEPWALADQDTKGCGSRFHKVRRPSLIPTTDSLHFYGLSDQPAARNNKPKPTSLTNQNPGRVSGVDASRYLVGYLLHICIDLVFPYTDDMPSQLRQPFVDLRITLHVPFQLRRPKFSIRFRQRPVQRAAMPKTSIHEHYHLATGKYDIRMPGQTRVHSVTQVFPPKRTPQRHLWCRVPLSYPAHQPTSFAISRHRRESVPVEASLGPAACHLVVVIGRHGLKINQDTHYDRT